MKLHSAPPPWVNERLRLVGQRVRLVRCTDRFTNLRPGERGTVTLVDDWGTVHVAWDGGSRLGLVPEAGDAFEIVSELPPATPIHTCSDGAPAFMVVTLDGKPATLEQAREAAAAVGCGPVFAEQEEVGAYQVGLSNALARALNEAGWLAIEVGSFRLEAEMP